MQILICDDDILFADKFEGKLKNCKVFNRRWKVHRACNKEELSKALTEFKIQPQIIFMDIELANDNGIEVANEVKKELKDVHIVFLTNHITYACDVYEVDHDYFVVKEQLDMRLEKVLEKVLESIGRKDDDIVLKENGVSTRILKRDILFCTRIGRKTEIYLNSGKCIKTSLKIDEMEERLHAGDFMRCHKSYIVSLEHVSLYSRSEIIVSEQYQVPISRQYIKSCKDSFNKWVEEQI